MIVNLFGMHDRRLCSVFNRSCAGDSIVLPQGSAAFRAIVACYPFCPEEAPALASDANLYPRRRRLGLASHCSAFVEKHGEDAPYPPFMALFGCRALFRCKSAGQVVFW